MSTINGIGTKFYGISELDSEGYVTATDWVTFLFLPIVPLGRVKLKREVTRPYTFQYSILHYEKLQLKEVLITYLYGRVIMPLLIVWPFMLIIPELQQALGLHIPSNGFNNPTIGDYYFIGAILWMLFVFGKFLSWNEKRWLPTNYKDILKQNEE